jgi:hypothetical protein
MWNTLSKDMLLYEIVPHTDPQQFLALLQLNKRTNNISKQFPIYDYMVKRKTKNKFRTTLACEFGNEIWTLYYVAKAIQNTKANYPQDTHDTNYLMIPATQSGNMNLVKRFNNDEHHIPYGLQVAVKYNRLNVIHYLLNNYKNIDLRMAVRTATAQNNQELFYLFVEYIKTNNHKTSFWEGRAAPRPPISASLRSSERYAHCLFFRKVY